MADTKKQKNKAKGRLIETAETRGELRETFKPKEKKLNVLLDSSCFLYMQRNSLTTESISELFPGKDIEFYITRHTVDKLERLGGSAVRAATACLIARCVNGVHCTDEAECVLFLVKEDNQDNLIVATEDKELYGKLSKMNVPLLRCSGKVIALLSPESKRAGSPQMKKKQKGRLIETAEKLRETFKPKEKKLNVLLDSACFLYMQRNSLTTESISELFPGKDIEFYITRHTVDKLERLGGSAVRAATACLIARCVNGVHCTDEAECVLFLVKEDNQDNLIVATADKELYGKLSKMNVPLLRCSGKVIALVSPESKRAGSPQMKKKQKVDTRNTIGDVPPEWYKYEGHAGYDKYGKRIMKGHKTDKLDEFLSRVDHPESWRLSIDDEFEGEEVEITNAEYQVAKKLAQGKTPRGH